MFPYKYNILANVYSYQIFFLAKHSVSHLVFAVYLLLTSVFFTLFFFFFWLTDFFYSKGQKLL